MEQFIERLDTVLDNDPFNDIDWSLLSQNDSELLEKYRSKYVEDRKRIREERKTKNFEEIMEDLLQELSNKPDISSFYRTLDEPLLTMNSIAKDVHKIELDTSDDEQDDLEHCTTWIDPSKSIGRSTHTDELKTSTYVVYPLTKSPARKIQRYADQPRRNTYTLQNSSSDDDQQLVNTKQEYVRLDSEGFDPQQQQQHENPFNNVKDARSTFSIPQKRYRYTHREAQDILYKKLGAFIKGYLTRQLFRTEHVQRLMHTLHDTQKFAVDFQTECLQTKTKLDPDDINIIDQLIKQVQSVLDEIHAIFGQYSSARQISMIVRHGQLQQLRTTRTNQRIAKTFSTERPIIDPLPVSTVKNDNVSKQSVRRPENIRRHVSAAPIRSAPSTTNTRTRPLKKATSVQRKSRPLNTNNNESTSNPPRSSSANNNNNNNNHNHNIFRPPLRLAPASPMFRNRLK
ncbi:unnamed protein product [Adineta steineri]|uniref:Uncharacterized protein n=1 Tax=Adineta steineri TaxID=433720 RepID=A0A818S0F7_9BILA|nr:unnamed protein product [Adineta steineri]CAF3662139.1 unnamed protein product [Adineta steineri]